MENEAGVGVLWRVRRGGMAGGAGCRDGGAAVEAVVWEVTAKEGALYLGCKKILRQF